MSFHKQKHGYSFIIDQTTLLGLLLRVGMNGHLKLILQSL